MKINDLDEEALQLLYGAWDPLVPEQVRELFAGVKAEPDVLGFVWFDYDKAGVGRDDWRIEDDPAALAAFRAAVKGFG